jgi:two-component system, NarL family, response regulator DesR
VAPRTETGSPTTVLLAAELGLLRHVLETVLSEQADITVVAAVEDHTALLRVAQRVRPDVVVIDIDQLDDDAARTVRQLRAWLPGTRVVALVAARPSVVLRGLLETGVVAAVDKNAPAVRLVDAVRDAAAGELVVHATVAVAALTAATNPLTIREREVLHLAATGATSAEIATHLRLSPGTVRNHLSKAIVKTGGRNRIDAVRIAQKAGWLQQPPSSRSRPAAGTTVGAARL